MRSFPMPHLKLDQSLVNEARILAQHIVEPVIAFIGAHTTVAIERTTLRLIGVDGINEEGVPLPNSVVDSALPLLPGGGSTSFSRIKQRSGCFSLKRIHHCRLRTSAIGVI